MLDKGVKVGRRLRPSSVGHMGSRPTELSMISHASNFILFDLAMGHKRKRSLQEVNLDISKMTLALQHMRALKDDLGEVEETEDVISSIMQHICKLEDILQKNGKIAVRTQYLSFDKMLNPSEKYVLIIE